MLPVGSLASYFGQVTGSGPGAGMSLMFLVFGFFSGLVGLAGYAFRVIRDAEEILPDHVMIAENTT